MFTNKSNRLCYIIGDQVFTMKHIDKKYFIIGHAHFNNRLFLADNENNVISYKIETKLIEYEIAIIKKEYQLANELLPSIPCNLLGHLALFLENQDLLDLALELTSDLDHKFDLALRLNKLNLAQEIAENLDNTNKWKELGRKSSALCRFDISLECYRKIKDVPALLFLSYVLNSSEILDETLQYAIAQKNINVAFLIYYVTGRVNDAINLLKTSDMEAEAAIMAYSYAPELLENTFDHWQENLGKINPKYAQKLAHPIKYPNLFPHQYSSNLVQEIMDINLNDVQ
uniref:Coatomer subunit beta' (Trinotate prediction) n=1 Tax=Henneguya salminicola TaxID=69463 RepID=A0A6G3MDT5_HENSL